ncbi:MAG: TonB-dependent receptor [Cyclobacteriaceae bacterium]
MKKLGMTLLGICVACVSYAQFSVSGTVKSKKAEVLPGATVSIKGATIGAIADGDGNYMIKDLAEGSYTLKAEYLGFKSWEKKIELTENLTVDFALEESVFQGEEIIVYATRANDKTPTTYSEVNKEEIADRNLGQDMPYILRFTPSMVTTSDAGAGVGYTGMRIRGSDNTRINVTVNGVPINDSESHGTFWVNMPDFASSVNNIQVQRGVGTSTNGAAAFGATISMQTSLPSEDAYGQIDNSFGSFGTRKHTAIFNTGLIKSKWSFEGRLSQIASDGYIDRASSDLKSYYLAAGYYGKNTTIKALTFSGKEVTYQSWYGTPEAKLSGNAEDIQTLIDWGGEYGTDEQLANLQNSDRSFNYYLYDNETDNYQQDHYQLHASHTFSQKLNVNAALHYTYGRGYYEQYRNDDDLADYGLSNITYLRDSIMSNAVDDDGNYYNSSFGSQLENEPEITFLPIIIDEDTVKNEAGDVYLDAIAQRSKTDLIRRRWLKNHFYGGTFSVNYTSGNLVTTLGGGYNFYDGDHFGEITWARFASGSEIRDRYYDNFGRKGDFNVYSKTNYQLGEKLNLFADLQVRMIDYNTKGVDSDLADIDAGDNYTFFNPKFGFSYSLSTQDSFYASFAVGNREPVRTDFIDAPNGATPKPETLRNLEAGYRLTTSNLSVAANYYLMDYKNQLVLTGALNDVGSAIRTNVPNSYRTGIELVVGVKIFETLDWNGNIALSQNKISNFKEVINKGGSPTVFESRDSDIAFSPSAIIGSSFLFEPVIGLTFELLSKYVGKQYLDNTQNNDRAIDPYFINDFKIDYSFSVKSVENIRLSLLVNNIFDVKYSSNGYTWGYYAGDFLYQQNNYYPQAGTNFLAGLSVRF